MLGVAILSWGTQLLEILPYIAGLIAGIRLRRRDRTTSLLVAFGFGLGLFDRVLHIAVVLIQYSQYVLLMSDGSFANVVGYVDVAVPPFAEIAAYVLIIVGLLRLVRRRTTATTEVTR